MNAMTPTFGDQTTGAILPGGRRAAFGHASASAMGMKWQALHDAANAVAALAGIAPQTMRPEVRSFPAAMRDAGGWRRELAEQGIDDLAAFMEPGLAALLAVHARGADPAVPAQALWQEYHAARAALLALAPA
jgi:hypothetical protein